MPAHLRDLRHDYHREQDRFADLMNAARLPDGSGYDFSRVPELAHLSPEEQRDEVDRRERKVHDLGVELKSQERYAEADDRLQREREERNRIVTTHVHAGATGGATKTLGQYVQDAMAKGKPRDSQSLWVDAEFPVEIKTLMQTSAGMAPIPTHSPRIAEMAVRPIQVTDAFPILDVSGTGSVTHYEETTLTNNAAETGEGLVFPEAALAYTLRTTTIRKIPTWIPVTDEQLGDAPVVPELIDTRLRYMVRARLDSQLILGDGIGVNIQGLINTPGAQSQARGTDDIPDAFYKAIKKVRVTGRANPNVIFMHPDNLQTLRLMRANGIYLFGSPATSGVTTLWSIPIVETDILPAGTGIVLDTTHTVLWMRQGAEVQVGYVNDDFIKGKQAVRATLRGALTVLRAAAICLVTGLN
jgi:HK97 family phage major capsid protein